MEHRLHDLTPDEPIRLLTSRAMAAHLGRRAFLGGALLSAGGGLLAACGGSSSGGVSTSASATSTIGTGPVEGNLNIYTWSEYSNPDDLKSFTTDKGPKIKLDSYASNEEMIAKLVAAKGTSGYDIVVPTGEFIPQMAANGLLQELNHAALPNMANVDPQFLDQPWDKGNKYSVVKDWGTTGFVYDKTKIKRELTNWADFLDAAQNEASGRTAVLDAPGDITGIFFWANDIDWNTTKKDDLDAAEDYLVKKLAPHIKAFDSYPSTAMAQGEYTLAQAWNGDARQGILNSKDPSIWQWVLGAPKTELWMDTWAIPVGAKNVNAAYAWINYVLDPKISLSELTYIGYNTGLKDIEATAKSQDVELPDLIFFDSAQVSTMVPGEVTEAQQRIVDIWNKLKATAGK